MAKHEDAPAYFIANDTFILGGTEIVSAGATVEAGHPMLKGREHLFRPFEPTFAKPAKGGGKAADAPKASPLAERTALVARAKELGIPAKGKSDDLQAAIAVAEAAAAAKAAEDAAAAAEAADADNGTPEPDPNGGE